MAYRIKIQVTNPTASPVSTTVHKGSLFEVKNPVSRVQNLVVTRSQNFTIPPHTTQVIEVESWCFNRRFASPSGESFAPTLFQTVESYGSQDAVWSDQERRQ